jgi:hypothetical protein
MRNISCLLFIKKDLLKIFKEETIKRLASWERALYASSQRKIEIKEKIK